MYCFSFSIKTRVNINAIDTYGLQTNQITSLLLAAVYTRNGGKFYSATKEKILGQQEQPLRSNLWHTYLLFPSGVLWQDYEFKSTSTHQTILHQVWQYEWHLIQPLLTFLCQYQPWYLQKKSLNLEVFIKSILNTAAPTYITVRYMGTVKIKQVFCYEMSVLLQCTRTSHCFLSVIIFPNTNHPSVHQWQHAILSIWLWDSFSTTLLFKSFWGTGDDRWWNCLPIHFVSG